MNQARCLRIIRVLLFLLGGLQMGLTVHAQDLNGIGVTLLRSVVTNADGTGIRVAQPEAQGTNIPPDFEVNPANSSVQQPVSLFTLHQYQWHRQCFPQQPGYGVGSCGHRGL